MQADFSAVRAKRLDFEATIKTICASDTIRMPINCVDPHFRSFRKTVVGEAVKRNMAIFAMQTLAFGRILNFNVASAVEASKSVWTHPVRVLISGCDQVEALDYNVYQAKNFMPVPESE